MSVPGAGEAHASAERPQNRAPICGPRTRRDHGPRPDGRPGESFRRLIHCPLSDRPDKATTDMIEITLNVGYMVMMHTMIVP